MRAAATVLVLVCLACAVPATAAAASPSSTTTIDIYVAADGDARWNVSVRYPLETEHERSAFRDLGARFERGDTDTTISADTVRALASRASEETGREMGIVDVNRTATIVNRSGGSTGILSLTFRWTAFARVDGGRVILGDVFVDGLEIESGQTLRIHPPPDYAIESFPPVQQEVTDGVVRWEGPVSFEPGEPAITYVPSRAGTTTTTATTTTTGPGPAGGGIVGLALAGGVVFGAAVVVAAVGVYGRRTHGTAFGWLSFPGGTPDGAGSGDAQPADTREGTAGDDVDEELLSDEERVERLLRRNGGRMKQADIVAETGWSNAKVSQLLSAMDEEGRVEKLQIGRENLISLPDEE